MYCMKDELGGWLKIESEDCSGHGMACYEFTSIYGEKLAGCLIAEVPCPEGAGEICFDNYIADCEYSKYPVMWFDCDDIDMVCVMDENIPECKPKADAGE